MQFKPRFDNLASEIISFKGVTKVKIEKKTKEGRLFETVSTA